jgi:hypothetical protein
MFKPALFKRAPCASRDPGGLAARLERLDAAGFPARLAQTLANDARYELRSLLELTERGCPPELAARILAPLEETDGRP